MILRVYDAQGNNAKEEDAFVNLRAYPTHSRTYRPVLTISGMVLGAVVSERFFSPVKSVSSIS